MNPGATTFAVIPRPPSSARDRAGHADQPGLRRRVVDLPGAAVQADHGGDEHDPSAPQPDHALAGAAGAAEGSGEVDVDHVVEVGVAHPHEQSVASDPGVGDEHLDRPESLLDGLEPGVDRLRRGDIAGDGEHAVGNLGAAGEGGDAVTESDETLGDRATDPARGAGDENGTGGVFMRHPVNLSDRHSHGRTLKE